MWVLGASFCICNTPADKDEADSMAWHDLPVLIPVLLDSSILHVEICPLISLKYDGEQCALNHSLTINLLFLGLY